MCKVPTTIELLKVLKHIFKEFLKIYRHLIFHSQICSFQFHLILELRQKKVIKGL